MNEGVCELTAQETTMTPNARSEVTTVVIEMELGWVYVKIADPKPDPDRIEFFLRRTINDWFDARRPDRKELQPLVQCFLFFLFRFFVLISSSNLAWPISTHSTSESHPTNFRPFRRQVIAVVKLPASGSHTRLRASEK